MEWPGLWVVVLVVGGSLLILCTVAVFLRWFLRLDEIVNMLHHIHDELKLVRRAQQRRRRGEHDEEEEWHL
ncbi:MAG: hypothetical protein ACE5JQ_11575 [Candidatus Methylomirabilales bacterium]